MDVKALKMPWSGPPRRSRLRSTSLIANIGVGRTFACGLLALLMTHFAMANEPRIVAHRGASHAAPENTLAAFHLAFEENADGIEGDFYLTSDDEIICHHDADTERTSGVKLVVENSTYAELRALDVGTWKGKAFAGERIPKFEEVLATVPEGKSFVIELKSGPEIVPVLTAKLEQRKQWPIDLLIISFDEATIRLCKTSMPDVRAHWLTGFQQEEGIKSVRPHAAEIAQIVRRCRADGVGFNGNAEHIDLAFMQRLKASGIDEYHVWTIDDPKLAQQYKTWKAFGITTNRPADIRSRLNQ